VHYVEYILELDQEKFPEEDINKYCAINSIGGYKECDKKSIRKSLDDLGLNNLTPIWATDSIDEVTGQFIVEKLSKSEILI
jgi:hypothetical protein